jgi:hypothetical protein
MILRGLKLQTVIQLVAEGKLTEGEIAARLGLSHGTLQRLHTEPVFMRRVRQVRADLGVHAGLDLERPQEDGLQCPKSAPPVDSTQPASYAYMFLRARVPKR